MNTTDSHFTLDDFEGYCPECHRRCLHCPFLPHTPKLIILCLLKVSSPPGLHVSDLGHRYRNHAQNYELGAEVEDGFHRRFDQLVQNGLVQGQSRNNGLVDWTLSVTGEEMLKRQWEYVPPRLRSL